MIAIIDYNMGNIRSVENALHRLNAEYVLTADRDVIAKADHVILPGVGHCGEAMHNLRERGLCQFIKDLRHPCTRHMRRHAGDVPPHRGG